MLRLCVLFLAIPWLAVPVAASEAADPPQIEAVQVGFEGTYKLGHWTPVWITVSGVTDPGTIRIELTTADGDGVQAAYRDERPVYGEAVDSERWRWLCYVKFGRSASPLRVRLLSGEHVLAERRFAAGELPSPLEATEELLLVLGPSIGEEEAVRRRQRGREGSVSVQRLERTDRLPRHWHGYEGVDTMIVTTHQTSLLEKMDEEQFAAFTQWLQLGGRLIWSVGERAEQVLSPGSRLAALAPGELVEVTAQRTTSGLQDYASATERLEAAGGQRIRRFSLPMAVLAEVRGLVESSETGGPSGYLPTIIRYPYGMGQAVFLAFDVEQPPLDQWQGRPALVRRILRSRVGRRGPSPEGPDRSQITHLGYDDLTGQLRAALDQFTDVTRVEFSWVAGLILVYILLIGPADYFLLKRVGRMHWTWLTFPLTVVAFTVLAIVLTTRFSGNRVQVNQVDLVDVDMDRAVARGTTWMHVYSPQTAAFDLGLETRWPLPADSIGKGGRLFGWQGLPGDGLGGLNTASTATLFPLGYAIRPANEADQTSPELLGVPIQVSSSKGLLARWWAEIDVPPSSELTIDRNGLLSGRLSHPLDVELHDAMVLFRNWTYPIGGTLQPGQTISFDGLPPRNLEWRLTRRRVVETRDVSTPWDRTSRDASRILEILMFHDAAGGRSYTDLTHRYQPYLDLSEHLRTGRAILVGRGPAASSLTRAGQSLDGAAIDRQTALYRIVFPVEEPR